MPNGFQHSFVSLPDSLHSRVAAVPLPDAKVLAVVSELQTELNLQMSKTELRDWLNGDGAWKGESRLATCYAGHQFGVWAGQLGDGRALSLGEVQGRKQRWDIQTKGSGPTPYSRGGDGRALVRSSVREFLASEALHGLGIPTTRALALLVSPEAVERETIESAALVARVLPSNLRFGHFEFAFHFDLPQDLERLRDYARAEFFPECESEDAFLREVVRRTATLVAKWQAVGFCHGVLNTDNMSLLGLTLDYGPYAFQERFDPHWIFNHTDHGGRYTYAQQPSVVMWNLDRLLWCFSANFETSVLREILNHYKTDYAEAWQAEMARKMGLPLQGEQSLTRITQFLTLLQELRLDWTQSFRELAEALPELPRAWVPHPQLCDWFAAYRRDLPQGAAEIQALQKQLLQINPKYILRQAWLQEIIKDVEKGRSDLLQQALVVVQNPFVAHPGMEEFAKVPDAESPATLLSCSS